MALLTRYAAYECADGSLEFGPARSLCLHVALREYLLNQRRSLLYEFEAASWDEAMDEHFRRQGWDPYDPFE